MITQSQYFDIEEYLEKEVRLIEPDFVQESIERFREYIEPKMASSQSFEISFEKAKEEFGSKRSLRRAQRSYQWASVKRYSQDVIEEFRGNFRGRALVYTVLWSIAIVALILYFKLQLPKWGEIGFWESKSVGFGTGFTFAMLIVLIANRFDRGTWGLQAHNWLSIVWIWGLWILFMLSTLLVQLDFPPLFPYLISSFSVVLITLVYFSLMRYINRNFSEM